MFRKKGLIISVLIFTLFFMVVTGCSKEEQPKAGIRDEMLAAVNKLRHVGCMCGATYMPPVAELKWNTLLEAAADEHVKDMVNNNYFSHIAPDGSFPIVRAQKAGYTGPYVGENIARGYTNVAGVVLGWENSEEHCMAMMDTLYAEMGASRLNDYWVLDFGRPQ
nr:CAP domain-containing protein [uncultured Mucilaginibacter sp.]